MNLLNILKNIEVVKVLNEQNINVNKVVTDTRKVNDNDIFVGIKGENFDGNELYVEAFKNGASVAIIDHLDEKNELYEYLNENNKTMIIVKDTIKALGCIAKYKRSIFKGRIIAITGSAGKTSTKDMIYSVLNEKYKVYKTKGNLNNHIGLPLSILEAELDNDFIILEMGMNHLGEISYLSKLISPDIAVITNVGTSHIGNLGSRENILKAKIEILDGLKNNGLLIINNDNDLLHKWYLENKDNFNIKRVGINNKSDFQAYNIILNENNSSFLIDKNEIKVSVGGEHFIYNALMGYAIGYLNNLNIDEIRTGILNLNLSSNRMNVINKDIKIIDDCYNSNYDSCKYALKYLGKFKERKIAVLGTMKELGEYSKEYHKMLGDVVILEKIDILITVGEFSNLINERVVELGFNKNNCFYFDNNNDAIIKINEIKRKGDVILVKASHSMNFKEIVEKINA